MDKSGPSHDAFKELCTATDLGLRATKATAQAIGKAMGNSVVLECHLWLNLTEIKDEDKISRPFSRFTFEWVAYQYTVLPCGLSLGEIGILDDWLVLVTNTILVARALSMRGIYSLG